MSILNMSVNEMPQAKFVCECGREHYFDVKAFAIGKNAIEKLPEIAEPFKSGKILVVFDNNTYRVAGKKACELLLNNGFSVKTISLFPTKRLSEGSFKALILT